MSHRCPTCGTADPIEHQLRLYNFRLGTVVCGMYLLPFLIWIAFSLSGWAQ